MEIHGWQEQIILGTLLGSGFMVRSPRRGQPRYYVGMSETRDEQWFRYKCEELKDVAARTPVCRSGGAWKWRSVASEGWSPFYDRLHSGGANAVGMDTLDRLRDIGLAVWFGDKGFWYTSRRVGLRTGKFGESNAVVAAYFNEVGMPCELRTDANGTTRVVFTRHGTLAFLATLGHRLPEYMHYRLSPEPRLGRPGEPW